MKDPLVRFGVAVEAPLLEEFDALVRARECTRSELLRDLARAEVVRAKIRSGASRVQRSRTSSRLSLTPLGRRGRDCASISMVSSISLQSGRKAPGGIAPVT